MNAVADLPIFSTRRRGWTGHIQRSIYSLSSRTSSRNHDKTSRSRTQKSVFSPQRPNDNVNRHDPLAETIACHIIVSTVMLRFSRSLPRRSARLKSYRSHFPHECVRACHKGSEPVLVVDGQIKSHNQPREQNHYAQPRPCGTGLTNVPGKFHPDHLSIDRA